MRTTIQVEGALGDRLRAHGRAGMTCDEILTSLWDAVARSEFLQGTRRRLQTLAGTDLVDLQAIG